MTYLRFGRGLLLKPLSEEDVIEMPNEVLLGLIELRRMISELKRWRH